jgi:hypothetical protein
VIGLYESERTFLCLRRIKGACDVTRYSGTISTFGHST